jgi:hypothetical protein
MISGYNLQVIKTYLDIAGFKDNQKSDLLKGSSSKEYLTDAQIEQQMKEGFSVKEFMGKGGIALDTMVSYDTKGKKSTSIVSFIGSKGVQTELRTAVINKLIQFNKDKQVFLGQGKDIAMNLEINLRDGFDKADELLSLLKAQHDRIAKQNREISSSYLKQYKLLTGFNGIKGLSELIKKEVVKLKKETEEIFLEAGVSSAMEGIVEFLMVNNKMAGAAPKTKDNITKLGNKLKNKFKASSKTKSIEEKLADKILERLRSVYARFQRLQELIGKVADLQVKEVKNNLVFFVKNKNGEDRDLLETKKP